MWVATWPERERLTDAVTPHVVKAADARSGQRVFDVGCGGGSLAIALADEVGPDGEVVGLDISSGLLELARRRGAEAGRSNVRFLHMDVQTGTLEPGPFDLAVSQFGVMFFDEPTAALAAIKSRLAPDGRFVFACWQSVERNPWHVGTALRPVLPPPATPPPGKSPVGPFAFGDEEYVRELLEAAGFGPVRADGHEATVRAPAQAVGDPSLFSLMGVPPEREDEAVARLDAHLARFAVGPGEFEYPLAFMVYEATA
jgi:SAM-dependent methyltransferase